MWSENETDKLTSPAGANTTKKDGKNKQRKQPLPDVLLGYITSAIWVMLAVACLYYTNFFYQLFHNPKIYQPFFTISMVCYTVIIIITLHISFVLPHYYKVDDVEEYNPKLIRVATVFGVAAVISLLIAIWPVWGYTTLLIFFFLWKGFFEISMFLPGGDIGGVLFILVNVLAVMSYKIIDHEGYIH